MSRQVTSDDRDTSVFKYSGAWFLSGTWSAASGASGTLSSTNDVNAYVSFATPAGATSFAYYGMLRSRGGLYGICIDCDPTSGSASFSNVDGFDAADAGNSEPTVLVSMAFAKPGVHVVTMRNQADSRGTPAGNSQLTLDRVVFQIAAPSTSTSTTVSVNPPTTSLTTSSSTSTSSTTSSTTTGKSQDTTGSTTSTSSGTSSGTSATGSTTSSGLNSSGTPGAVGLGGSSTTGSFTSSSDGIFGATASPDTTGQSSPSTPVGTVVGSVLGSLGAIACILLVVFWLRLRLRQRKSQPPGADRPTSPAPRPAEPPANYVQPFIHTPTPLSSSAADSTTALMSSTDTTTLPPTITSRLSINSIEKRRSYRRDITATSDASSSSVRQSLIAPSTITGRERDAGPLSAYAEEDEELPPPEYSQIYST